MTLPVDPRELSEWLRRCPACRGHAGEHVHDVPKGNGVYGARWVPCEWCGPQREKLWREHKAEVETLC